MRNKKGITLIALIITIIVMLILAVITINMIIGEDGIIKRAQEASKEFNRQARKEKILLEDSIFITVNGNNHQVTGTTKQEMADIIVKNDLETNYLTILVEIVNGKKIENIVYRYDLVTEEQRKKLEAEGIYRLKGDANKDGILDENDVSIIRNYIGYVIDRNNEHIIQTCDMNNDGKILSSDTSILRDIIGGIELGESIYKNEKNI